MVKILSIGDNPKVGKDNIFVSLWESFKALSFFVRLSILTGILILVSVPFIVNNPQIFKPYGQTPTIYAVVAEGKWSNVGTWNTGILPKEGDIVGINSNQIITYDQSSTTTIAGMNINAGGQLIFDPTKSATLESKGNVVVSGTLRMRPANADILHTLRFINIDESKFVGGER